MTQKSSLNNPLAWMTHPWTRSLTPLHGFLSYMARCPHTSPSTSKVLCGINIAANSERSAYASIDRILPYHLSITASPAVGIGNSAQINGFDLIWLFVIYLIRITCSWLDLNHLFLTWSNVPVPNLIRLTGSWPDSTQRFLIYLTLCFQLNLTQCFFLVSNKFSRFHWTHGFWQD